MRTNPPGRYARNGWGEKPWNVVRIGEEVATCPASLESRRSTQGRPCAEPPAAGPTGQGHASYPETFIQSFCWLRPEIRAVDTSVPCTLTRSVAATTGICDAPVLTCTLTL
jgi:hypothetical protein